MRKFTFTRWCWAICFSLVAGNSGALEAGFGEDQEGEIYVCGSSVLGPCGNTGVVYKLVGHTSAHNRSLYE